MMLTLLKAMYERFRDNIVEANRLEKKREKTYAENLKKWQASIDKGQNRSSLQFMKNYWDKSHKLGKEHYHAMLKVAHAGMQRLQMAIDMMGKAVAGKKLDGDELKALKSSLPPTPTVVFTQVKKQLLEFCRTSLLELSEAKETQ